MKKIVFDFDGTLVDSMPYWAKGMLSLLESRGISYPDDVIKIVTPLGFLGTAEYFINALGVKESKEKLLEEMHEAIADAYTYHIPAKEGVKEKLVELKKQGYSLNVLTASPHATLDVCLKRVGLYDLFDNVWSCDDFFTTKSDEKIYHRVAEKLHTTVDNCIFLDDNLNAVTVAKKAGMQVIGVFDESSKDYVSEIKEVAFRYVYHFSELVIG